MATGRYSYTRIVSPIKADTQRGPRRYRTTKYPEVPLVESDIYVYANTGDRFDSLAQQYYNNSSYWWIISIANDNLLQNSLTPPVGSQIRIPANPVPIIAEFKLINS